MSRECPIRERECYWAGMDYAWDPEAEDEFPVFVCDHKDKEHGAGCPVKGVVAMWNPLKVLGRKMYSVLLGGVMIDQCDSLEELYDKYGKVPIYN